MARFRTSGIAWDGQPWVLAPALVSFAAQIEVIRPTPHAADGTVAGKGHDANSPNSDHTVWPKSGSGVVYAIDVGETAPELIDELWDRMRIERDPRLKYAIHDLRMFSSYPTSSHPAWTWRPYGGPNPHQAHGHLSIHHATNLSNDPSLWVLTDEEDDMPLNQVEKAVVDIAFSLLGAAGQRSYWYNKEPDDPEFVDLRNAIDIGAAALLARVSAGVTEARVKELIAKTKLAP